MVELTNINYRVPKPERLLIAAIADRAMRLTNLSTLQVEMDLIAAHANSYPLQLATLIEADNREFCLEIMGITQNIDRQTGALLNGFWPRFAANQKPEMTTA